MAVATWQPDVVASGDEEYSLPMPSTDKDHTTSLYTISVNGVLLSLDFRPCSVHVPPRTTIPIALVL